MRTDFWPIVSLRITLVWLICMVASFHRSPTSGKSVSFSWSAAGAIVIDLGGISPSGYWSASGTPESPDGNEPSLIRTRWPAQEEMSRHPGCARNRADRRVPAGPLCA
jgi:hypothetical protein